MKEKLEIEIVDLEHLQNIFERQQRALREIALTLQGFGEDSKFLLEYHKSMLPLIKEISDIKLNVGQEAQEWVAKNKDFISFCQGSFFRSLDGFKKEVDSFEKLKSEVGVLLRSLFDVHEVTLSRLREFESFADFFLKKDEASELEKLLSTLVEAIQIRIIHLEENSAIQFNELSSVVQENRRALEKLQKSEVVFLDRLEKIEMGAQRQYAHLLNTLEGNFLFYKMNPVEIDKKLLIFLIVFCVVGWLL